MVDHDCSRQVGQAIDNLVKLELVMFFHRNPETLDDLCGISRRLGYSPEVIGSAMPGLVAAGLLTQHGQGPAALYRYTQDPEVRRVVEGDYSSRYQTKAERRRLESALTAKGVV